MRVTQSYNSSWVPSRLIYLEYLNFLHFVCPKKETSYILYGKSFMFLNLCERVPCHAISLCDMSQRTNPTEYYYKTGLTEALWKDLGGGQEKWKQLGYYHCYTCPPAPSKAYHSPSINGSMHPQIKGTHGWCFMFTAYSTKHTYRHQPPWKIRRQIRGLELLPHLWPTPSLGFGFGFG